MPTALLEITRGSQDGEVGAFGAPASEDNLAGFAAPEGGHPLPRIVEQGAGPSTDVMNAGRVAEDLAQVRQHGLTNRWVERSRRVIIEIDSAHANGELPGRQPQEKRSSVRGSAVFE